MQSTEQKLREALQAFEKRGTGFDSCPTRRLPQSDEAKQIDQWWLRYFMDADLSVRSLARQAFAQPTDDVKSVLQSALNVLGCLEYGITGVDSWPCEDSVEDVIHRIRKVLEESQ